MPKDSSEFRYAFFSVLAEPAEPGAGVLARGFVETRNTPVSFFGSLKDPSKRFKDIKSKICMRAAQFLQNTDE